MLSESEFISLSYLTLISSSFPLTSIDGSLIDIANMISVVSAFHHKQMNNQRYSDAMTAALAAASSGAKNAETFVNTREAPGERVAGG